jgi:hypothetical protein
MVAIDYIIIAIVIISAVTGLVQGFLREVCALITWVLAVWLAWKFGPLIEPHLGGALRQAPYGLWAGRGIVFIAVLVVGGIIGAIVNYYIIQRPGSAAGLGAGLAARGGDRGRNHGSGAASEIGWRGVVAQVELVAAFAAGGELAALAGGRATARTLRPAGLT